MNRELPDVQAGFRKVIELPTSWWIIKKAREFQKNIYFCFIDYAKAFDCMDPNKLWEILRDGNTRPRAMPPEKCRSRSNSWGCILSLCLFNLHAEYIIWNARLDEAQAGIKIAERNINDLRYTDDTTLMAESEELKSLLMKVKEENEKVGLNLNIQKMKIMASGPVTSRQIAGETMEAVRDFIFWAPKSLQMVTTAMKLKDACTLEEKLWPT